MIRKSEIARSQCYSFLPFPKKGRFLLLLLLLAGMISGQAYGQARIYLGFHAGATAHFPTMGTTEPTIQGKTPVLSGSINFTADVRLDQRATYLHLAIGSFSPMLRYQLTEVQSGDRRHQLTGGYAIQLALKHRQNLWQNRLFVVLMAGAQIANYRGHQYNETTTLYTHNNVPVNEIIFIEPYNREFAFFPMGGLCLEYAFDFGLVVSARAYYAHGLREVTEGIISYQIEGEAFKATRFSSSFSHLPVQLGASFAISSLWDD